MGDDPLFPHLETGWQQIYNQIHYCKDIGKPYMIVDAKDFRNHPKLIFKQIFTRQDLPFKVDMLLWKSRPDVDIDNFEGDHHHLYQEVLSSTGMHPDMDAIPALQSFPVENGYRAHVKQCMHIHQPGSKFQSIICVSIPKVGPTRVDKQLEVNKKEHLQA